MTPNGALSGRAATRLPLVSRQTVARTLSTIKDESASLLAQPEIRRAIALIGRSMGSAERQAFTGGVCLALELLEAQALADENEKRVILTGTAS